MRWLAAFAFTLLSLAAAADGRAKPGELLELFVGRAHVLPVTDVNRIIVGNVGLLSTTILGDNEVVLLPEQAGETNVILYRDVGTPLQYEVRVAPSDQYRELLDVRELLQDIPGLKVRNVAGRVLVSGEVPERFVPQIDAVKQLFPNLVSLATPQTAFSEQMVFLDVRFLEFNRSRIRELGVNWTTVAQGPAGAFGRIYEQSFQNRFPDVVGFETAVPSDEAFPLVVPPREVPQPGGGGVQQIPIESVQSFGLFGLATSISSTVNYLVNRGDAVLIAEPSLSARSGGKATFLAGGEIPIIIDGGINGPSVEYKQFGITLDLSPQVDDEGQVVANIKAEVSSIDAGSSIDGQAPAFRTRRTETDVLIRSGETLVISGLVNAEMGESVNGIAGLSDLPILGPLFRSRSFREQETELLVLISPRVLPVHDQAATKQDESLAQQISDLDDLIQRAFAR